MTRKFSLLSIFIAIFLSLMWVSAGAEIYYWTNENGVRRFSDSPPPSGAKNAGRMEGISYQRQSARARHENEQNKVKDLSTDIEKKSHAAKAPEVAAVAPEEELSGSDVYVVGSSAYIAVGSSGLYVVDVRRPVNPQWVASVDTTGEAKGVYTISGFAYVADGPAGLQLVNNRELRSLRIVVSYNTLGETRNVYGLASTVYVAGSGFGLGVFDVINRSSLNTNGHFLVHPYR